MPYSIEVNDVTRDFFQGLYGNRIPLDDPDSLEIFWSFIKLRLLSKEDSTLKIGAFECGGAQPQVDSVFLGKNPTETLRHLMEYAQTKFKEEVASGKLDASLAEKLNMALRPLWRGANGFNLEPMAKEDLEFILEKMAKDVAPINTGNELRVKAFDSQGVIKELEFTAKKIADLRTKGHNVTLEVGIPYSNGEGIDPNPYTDEFFVNKFLAAAKLAKDSGLPDSAFRIGLKDMVGELNAENAKRLTGKIIDALKDHGFNITLGFHLHDTGLAASAYAAADTVAKEKNWSIAIDTVNSFDNKENGHKVTGFASLARIENAGVELDLSEEQKAEIQKIAKANERLIERFALKRVEATLDGETMRRCQIPGGGFASFVAAVHSLGAKNEGLAELLGLTKNEAVELAAESLVAVGKLTGWPFAVTPGFQNKQIAGLNMLKNMIDAGVLKKGTPITDLKHTLQKDLSDQQVKDLFLKNIPAAVKNFLMGEMPAEMRSVVRKEVGLRSGTLTDGLTSRLQDAKEIVKKLQDEGKVEEKSFDDVVVRALILGVDKIRNAVEKSWLREPDASYFWSKETGHDKEGYDRAMAKYKAGLRWEPDAIEKIRASLTQGVADSVTIAAAHKQIEGLRQAEKKEIEQSVISAIKANINLASISAEDIVKLAGNLEQNDTETLRQPLKAFFKNIYNKQQDIVIQNLNNGYQFIYTKDQRIDIALAFAAEQLANISADINSGKNPIYSEIANKAALDAKDEMEKQVVRSPLAGTITQIKVSAGQSVKKGQELFVVEAAKMLTTVYADKDFDISEIQLKPKDFVGKDQALFTLKTKEAQVANSNLRAADEKTLKSVDKALQTTDAKDKEVEIAAPKKREKEQSTSQKRGYNRKELTPSSENTLLKDNNIIHVVGNRGGCASKIIGDLEQLGQDYRLLYVPSDASTPVVKAADANRLIALKEFKANPNKKTDKDPDQVLAGYVDQEQIIEKLTTLAEKNPGKTIHFHPGWGFLAEKEDFVAKLEALKEKGVNVLFVGPNSQQMEAAGGKKTLRDLVQSVAPEFNPGYFGDAQSSEEHFDKIVNELGGDVMLKAIAGGGGRGIQPFKNDTNKSREENYSEYKRLLELNKSDSMRLFANGEIMAEQRIRGNTRHIEIQFAATAGQAISLGMRDCTAQNSGQKFVEINVIQGDYSPKLIAKIKEAGEKVSQKLAKEGYQGLGTLEMLVVPATGEVKILEVNPRVQVEHGVTEKDIELKTGKTVSLPAFNSFLKDNPENKSPKEIFGDLYGLAAEKIDEVQNPGTERVVHFRINSKEVDLVSGTATPSYVLDPSWPTSVSTDIASEHDVTLIQGGLGGGNYDPQIGALLGKEKNVKAALEDLFKFLQISQVSDRKYDKTNLGFIGQIYKHMFNEAGTVNHEFSTKTVDSLLKTISTSGELVKKLGFYIEKLDNEIATSPVVLTDEAGADLDKIHACRKSVNDLLKAHLNGTDVKITHLDSTTKTIKTLKDMFEEDDRFYFKKEANSAEIDKITASAKNGQFVLMEDKKASADLFPGEKALSKDALDGVFKMISTPAVAKTDALVHANSVFTPMSPPFAQRHKAGAIDPEAIKKQVASRGRSVSGGDQ